MNHFDLTKTVLALADFQPPDGVQHVVVLHPRPGLCRVAVGLSAIEGETTYVELTEPPSEPALRALYRAAQSILDAAWDSTVETGPSWAASLGLDMTNVGADE